MDLGIAGRRRWCAPPARDWGAAAPRRSPRRRRRRHRRAHGATLEAHADEIGARYGAARACGRVRHHQPEGRAAALAACPTPDILVNNAGGPPPGDFREFTATRGSARSTPTC